MEKYVYFFGGKKADGTGDMKALLGGKGAGLAEMTNLKIPVPPGFTITTKACTYYFKNQGKIPPGLKKEVKEAIKKLEMEVGAKFGDPKNPLTVSVRSGAPVSMPGMMDTILNLGLNWETTKGLAEKTKNPRFAYDCFRRFIMMYADVVMGVPRSKIEQVLEEKKKEYGVKLDSELSEKALKEICEESLKVVKEFAKKDLPEKPEEQLWGAIEAVFKSWNNERAVIYRRQNKISDDLGTAVNVQTMVFGNMGETSATGVAFTRNPATGEPEFYGEFLTNAQGEDVVAGIRTPQPISKLKEIMPEAYNQLLQIKKILENRYKDMQDIEFTIQEGKLYMLQTRTGKRTGFAAIRIAVDMVEEGLISEEEAILQVDPHLLTHVLAATFVEEEKKKAEKEGRLLAKGLNAGPGAASGMIAFTAKRAVEMAEKKQKVILVRTETSPEDVAGMYSAAGILTQRGGMTSHAAVVARGIGKPCVVGCGALYINEEENYMEVKGKKFKEGDYISIDGTTGEVFEGLIPTQESEILRIKIRKDLKEEEAKFYPYFKKFMDWCNKYRKLKIRTNADLPADALNARVLGAEGIGLCRTEHMFFEEKRIPVVREMIIAGTKEEREKALKKIEPLQQQDFEGIFRVMDGLPVTIRLLDPPLHEFLPHEDEQIEVVAKTMGLPAEKIRAKVQELKEANPMMGHRGVRLVITYPEIAEMQTRAIIRAACKVKKEGIKVIPEIMVPLVGIEKEFEILEEIIRNTAAKVMEEEGEKIEYLVGTMIELPRACIVADKIAEKAEFFSFGTNDLTQMTFGISRDDYNKFINQYLDLKILKEDLFQSLDISGVGELVKMGTEKGRSQRKNLKVGVCGEHGGDPKSIAFFHSIGFDYVSCSPFRVPVAIAAAAYAAITGGKMKGGD